MIDGLIYWLSGSVWVVGTSSVYSKYAKIRMKCGMFNQNAWMQSVMKLKNIHIMSNMHNAVKVLHNEHIKRNGR